LAPGGSAFLAEGIAIDQNRRAIRRSRIYEGPSGRLLHELDTRLKPDYGTNACFDPSGKVLAVALHQDEVYGRYSVFDLPGLKYRGAAQFPAICLSPGAIWSMGLTSDQPPELVLADVARGQELLRIAHEVGAHWLSFEISPDDRHVMFGRVDGTISVLDRVEVGRRLSELHLGW
jgi:hypothetical protein